MQRITKNKFIGALFILILLLSNIVLIKHLLEIKKQKIGIYEQISLLLSTQQYEDFNSLIINIGIDILYMDINDLIQSNREILCNQLDFETLNIIKEEFNKQAFFNKEKRIVLNDKIDFIKKECQ